jgi:hypothetical protein
MDQKKPLDERLFLLCRGLSLKRAILGVMSAFAIIGCQSTPEPMRPDALFRGRIAGAAIAQLKDEGFSCWLEQRRHVPGLDVETRHALHKTRPVLFCSKWDPTPGLPCVERLYAFEVEWADAGALDEALVEQLRTRRIAREHYRCTRNV